MLYQNYVSNLKNATENSLYKRVKRSSWTANIGEGCSEKIKYITGCIHPKTQAKISLCLKDKCTAQDKTLLETSIGLNSKYPLK